MKKIILNISVFLLCLANYSYALGTFKMNSIVGTYNCMGHDPFANRNYHGRTSIKQSGATYQFKWNFGKKMVYTGTGVFNTHEKSLIAVVFSDPNAPKYTGVQLYKIHANGTLTGSWTIENQTKIGTEVCKKIN